MTRSVLLLYGGDVSGPVYQFRLSRPVALNVAGGRVRKARYAQSDLQLQRKKCVSEWPASD